jgi:hypothetical protein
MLTYDTAFELSRQRVDAARARATLLGSLGDTRRPRSIPAFRRIVLPLASTVEVRHATPDKTGLNRGLEDLAVSRLKAS